MKNISLVKLALAFLGFAASVFAGDPSGTWKFTAEGPNGRSAESTLVLKLDGQNLSGTIENKAGKTDIGDARFSNDEVSFTVDRKIRRRTLEIRYSGKLEGDTIKGTIQTNGREGKAISIPWEATRQK